MKRFSDYSIKTKLVFIIVTVTFIASGFGTIILILNQYNVLKNHAIEDAETNAFFIARNSAGPLTFDLPEGIQEDLEALKDNKAVMLAIVYDTNGVAFAHYFKKGETDTLGALEKRHYETSSYIQDNYVEVLYPIEHQDINYGVVLLRYSLEALYESINYFVYVNLIIFIIIIALTYILARIIQRVLSEPILNLSKVTDQIRSKSDYSLRAEKRGNDEIGVLYDGFNSMLNQIEARKKERDSAEREKEKLNLELKDKNKELEQIIYVTSHDLRSPLVNIQGFSKELEYSVNDIVDIISATGIDDEPKRQIANIYDNEIQESIKFILIGISKMDTLLNGLLQLSRLGRAAIEIIKIDMNKLINNVIGTLKYQIQKKSCDVIVNDLHDCYADINQINIVFSNLIENAVKYLKGNIKGVIKIYSTEEDKEIIYCVDDNGVGINPMHWNKIFEIFHRLNPDASEGEGLGLTIVVKILDRMKGRLWLESIPNEGSRFFVAIPKHVFITTKPEE